MDTNVRASMLSPQMPEQASSSSIHLQPSESLRWTNLPTTGSTSIASVAQSKTGAGSTTKLLPPHLPPKRVDTWCHPAMASYSSRPPLTRAPVSPSFVVQPLTPVTGRLSRPVPVPTKKQLNDYLVKHMSMPAGLGRAGGSRAMCSTYTYYFPRCCRWAVVQRQVFCQS